MADDAKALIRSIPTDNLPGLRDRAIIATMIYSFARVSATLGMDVKDVFPMHHRLWLRLAEKGGKHHEVPCHHNLETYLLEYIDAAGIEEGPLFRTLRGRSGKLNEKRLHRAECWAMIKRRCRQAGMENADTGGPQSLDSLIEVFELTGSDWLLVTTVSDDQVVSLPPFKSSPFDLSVL